jgi:hypothetical protein
MLVTSHGSIGSALDTVVNAVSSIHSVFPISVIFISSWYAHLTDETETKKHCCILLDNEHTAKVTNEIEVAKTARKR